MSISTIVVASIADRIDGNGDMGTSLRFKIKEGKTTKRNREPTLLLYYMYTDLVSYEKT